MKKKKKKKKIELSWRYNEKLKSDQHDISTAKVTKVELIGITKESKLKLKPFKTFAYEISDKTK